MKFSRDWSEADREILALIDYDEEENDRISDANKRKAEIYLRRIEEGHLVPSAPDLPQLLRRYIAFQSITVSKENPLSWDDWDDYREISEQLRNLGIIDIHDAAIDKWKRDNGLLPKTAEVVSLRAIGALERKPEDGQ